MSSLLLQINQNILFPRTLLYRYFCNQTLKNCQARRHYFKQIPRFHVVNKTRCFQKFHGRMESEKNATNPLCIRDYDVIGFDIDHTLAKYNLPNLFNLVHEKFAKVLIEEKGYDATLLEPFEMHKDLCTRGICADLVKGNFLKVGKEGVILRANHGTKSMTEQEIQAAYGKDKVFPHYEKFLETADNIKRNDALECFMFDNFYDMIALVIIARMVDLTDEKAGHKLETYDIFRDVQAALNSAYHYTNFAAKIGGFFPIFEENTGDYVEKLSTDVKEWLKRLKDQGKVLFLMTSSYVDFASCTMNYIMGPEWKDYFDSIITYSRKPSFFHSNNHFRRLEGASEKEPIIDLKSGEVYSQGNLATFNKLVVKLTGKEQPKVIYFGDGLRSDIVPAKKFANWDTVYIYEEMEAEMGQVVRTKPQSEKLTNEKEDNSDEPARKKLKTDADSQGEITQKAEQVPSAKEREYLSSSRWGSFLVDDAADRLKATMYGVLMRKYTDLVIPQMSYIANLPLDHPFSRISSEDLSVEGFYPRPPEILRNVSVKDVKSTSKNSS